MTRRGLMLALLLLLAACRPAGSQAPGEPAARDTVAAAVQSVNYMHERSTQYTLYDLTVSPAQAVGGSIVDRLQAGGDRGCCVALPKVWRPGRRVRLEWEESDREQIHPKQTREMEIPKYDVPGDLYVVFLPKHAVELVVSNAEPGHPQWKGSIAQNPWDACVAANGRRPCFLALPKLFDTKSYVGFCNSVKDQRLADAEALCSSATRHCLQDFEDDGFCREILWGAPVK